MNDVIYGRLQQGVSIEYEFTTELSGNSVVATLNGEDEKPAGKTTEQSKSPVETQAAAAAFVNSGADTVAAAVWPARYSWLETAVRKCLALWAAAV